MLLQAGLHGLTHGNISSFANIGWQPILCVAGWWCDTIWRRCVDNPSGFAGDHLVDEGSNDSKIAQNTDIQGFTDAIDVNVFDANVWCPESVVVQDVRYTNLLDNLFT